MKYVWKLKWEIPFRKDSDSTHGYSRADSWALELNLLSRTQRTRM